MPNHFPNPQNPPAAFTTNVYVLLHGGHPVDLQLSILDARNSGELIADSVVQVEAPDQVLLSGKLKEQADKLEVESKANVAKEAGEIATKRQLGLTECKTVHWNRPHRQGHTVVRLLQLCSLEAKSKSFWAVFAVENRSDTTLYLSNAALVPGVAANTEDARWRFEQERLTFGEKTIAMASVTLKPDEPIPSKWQLVVTPKSLDRDAVRVESISF